MEKPNSQTTTWLAALMVVAISGRSVIRYENIPLESMAARSCCASGVTGAGRCVSSEDARKPQQAYPVGGATYVR